MDGSDVDFRIRGESLTAWPSVENVRDLGHAGSIIARLAICQYDKSEIAPLTPEVSLCGMTSAAASSSTDDMSPAAIGYRLRLIREAFGRSKSEMADLLDIDRPAWSRFENGVRAIPNEKAARVVERFNVTLDFIILGRTNQLPFETLERLRAAGLRV